jgi:hypothetical protein
VTNLHQQGVIGEVADAVRNPVGETHEDVDGVFSRLHEVLKHADVMCPSELEALIVRTFRQYSLPIKLLYVDATFNYIDYYAPHLTDLKGFGYSTKNNGYHVFGMRPAERSSASASASASSAASSSASASSAASAGSAADSAAEAARDQVTASR